LACRRTRPLDLRHDEAVTLFCSMAALVKFFCFLFGAEEGT
jgi:hypothetical protein